MKKRKLLLISLISIIFSISAMGSSAFFNAEDTAHNVITSGSVNISVVETMLDGTELKDFPAEGIRGVMPGSTPPCRRSSGSGTPAARRPGFASGSIPP